MAEGRKTEDSVYDFLYVDTRRIAQFSSQFNQYGHLTNLTRSVSETSTGGGDINVVAARVNKSASEQTGQVRQFDPKWLNPLTFLDDAERRGLIKRDIKSSEIGQIVLFTGQLLLFDAGMMKGAWDKPIVQKMIRAGIPAAASGVDTSGLSRHDRRIRAKETKESANNELDFTMSMLSILPHMLQVRMLSEDTSVWSTLEDEFVIGRSSDLVLKHGSLLSGEWNMIGIYDALPYDAAYRTEEGREDADIAADVAGTVIGGMAARMGIIARNMIGRPEHTYGMTPLLIFREVSS
ncbi:hypothetical protein [Methylobacterium indicum]|uniref:Uncharacterized protein n=1 Tax=Methylobacterium indicum TaxID=1775910 RepID=A0A8H9C772_9HYPH|nr:hypothetical protein [Methylobacterium indicum]BCM84421.1 hypothetical protein mvi_28820 [Methylobacterium indicum]